MGELIDLLTNWAHWGFEIISGLVIGMFLSTLSLLVPERYNPAKRLVARHDRNKHADLVGWSPEDAESILRHARRYEVHDGG